MKLLLNWRYTLVAALALLVTFGASATTVLYADLATLGERANLIVTGTVTATETVEREDATGFGVFTDYTLTVESVEKGEPSTSTLTIRLPGGTLDDGRRVEVDGIPHFDEGQRYLLVLWALEGERFGEPGSGEWYYVPLGLQLGIWTLSDDGTAVRDLSDLTLHVEPGQTPPPVKGREVSTRLDVLEALR